MICENDCDCVVTVVCSLGNRKSGCILFFHTLVAAESLDISSFPRILVSNADCAGLVPDDALEDFGTSSRIG